MANDTIKVETRDHLLATLAEAAELEHNLMCMYLFAIFSLKNSEAEDLSRAELTAVKRWRKLILDVAIQEMGHLALVGNLTTAIGGNAHFQRNNFPVRPGHFPAEFVMHLRKFDQETLDHFIFLERPETEDIADDEHSEQTLKYERGSPRQRLAAFVGDYETVGELYHAVAKGFKYLSKDLGQKTLFCGNPNLQIGPADVQLEGLDIITNEVSAKQAIQKIVEQGEGAVSTKGSHFETFSTIRDEYEQLLKANPRFAPARPTVTNPVMRKPMPDERGVVWVTHPVSEKYMDLSNGLYNLMLRFLIQIYSQSERAPHGKSKLLSSAFSTMHALSASASVLSALPATLDGDGNAGISFAINRFMSPYDQSCEIEVLKEQVVKVLDYVNSLTDEFDADFESIADARSKFEHMHTIAKQMNSCLQALKGFDDVEEES